MDSLNEFRDMYISKRCINRLSIYINGKKVSWKRAFKSSFGYLSQYEGDIDKIRDDAEARGEQYYYIGINNGRIEEAEPRYVYDIHCTLTQEQYDKIFGDIDNGSN